MSDTQVQENVIPMDEKTYKFTEDDVTREKFFQLYFKSSAINNLTWMGVKLLKCPFDLWNYHEIIFEKTPNVIIECGTYNGGSALYMAHLFDLMGSGRVITVDIESKVHPQHPRITYVHGSSTDPEIVAKVKAMIKPEEKVMVILDSDHTTTHVTNELNAYADMVSNDQYLIVEDTFIFNSETGESPRIAVENFFKDPKRDKEFVIDLARHKFQITLNPYGYLYKKGLWGRQIGQMVK